MDFDRPEGQMEVQSAHDTSSKRGMLQDAIFPAFGNDAGAPSVESPEQLQKNDPLGTQIWKLYSRAKTQLPNAERMENLTWRMMAMNMRRAEMDRNKGPAPDAHHAELMPPPPSTAGARPPPRSAPSGIAQQLRKSQDQQAQVQQNSPHDAMNLDDFIFPSSVGSPAGLSPELSNEDAAPFNATAPAIPIRKPHLANDHNLSLARASAPSVPPTIHREDEFGYVPRHVRKTSIDERRPPKRRAEASPLVPPVNSIMIPTDAQAEHDLHQYSLDHSMQPPTFPASQAQAPFSIDTFSMHDDPVIHSAGPYQQNFSGFSPVGSPLMSHNAFNSNMFNQQSMASSLNSTDYYSPPSSAFPSTVSTPQPIPEDNQMYFDRSGMDIRNSHGGASYGPHRPSNLSTSMQPQFIFNPGAGGPDSVFSPVTSTSGSLPFSSASSFGQSSHVDPSQVLHNHLPLRQQHEMQMGRQENMFTFGADSDAEDDEGSAFADRTMPQDYSQMEDGSLDFNAGYQWETNLSNQFNPMQARYPAGPPRKTVTIGGTEMVHSPQDHWSPGGSLGRTHGSAASLHGVVRPLSLKTDVIKKRNRGSGNAPVGTTSTRSSKKSSRKNSIAHTPVTTPTSHKAAESESPKSTGSGGGASGTMSSSTTPTSSKPSGVVPIAPGPPKSNSSVNLAQTRTVAPAPKRVRGSSKAESQELEMGDADDTSGRAPLRRKDTAIASPSPFPGQNLGALPMGAMGQGLQSSGPAEWEWLTMSL
ncbi:hypothetical protein J4E89_002453 [Alternaria sp. Ai002NY15]|nr:hypothetical protein J4E89_002453 [Alternaria sp. Ai002NY15]